MTTFPAGKLANQSYLGKKTDLQKSLLTQKLFQSVENKSVLFPISRKELWGNISNVLRAMEITMFSEPFRNRDANHSR
jgi:hypothetical protein